MKMKQYLSLFISSSIGVVVLALGHWPFSSFAAFPDVPQDHPNRVAIEFLQERGIISGNPDGTFSPDKLVNRAEFLKMALTSSPLASEPGAGLSFPDVSSSDWFYDFVRRAFHRQIVQGYPDGTFGPGQSVIRVEAIKMLLNAHGIVTSAPLSQIFDDVPTDAWFAGFAHYADDKNLLERTGKHFNPSQKMTRGQLAELIYRLLIVQEQNLDRFQAPQPPKGSSTASGRTISVTNGVKHSVPLSDILGGGPPKDGIPSIDDPQFTTVAEADEFLDDNGLGVAFSANGIDRFYPHQITVWHEIVNDNVGGTDALITYCPLCGTGIVFDPILDGEAVEFGTSGKLWNSNLVMYDRKTDTYWSQVLGEAILGELTGQKLKLLPYDNLRWKDWKAAHPNGQVLSRETGHVRDYTQSPYGDYDNNSSVFFPVDATDNRYHEKEPTFGIELNGQFKVYPQSELQLSPSFFTDEFAGVELEVTFDKETSSISIINRDTGDEIVPFYGFWFSWIAVHPESEVFVGP